MEIDDKLKNRLAGTAVVTVLAIIFLPMIFDTPVEKKEQVVSELDIPHKPEVSPLLTTAIVPDKNAVATAKPQLAAAANAGTKTAGTKKASTTSALSELEQEPPAPVKKASQKTTIEVETTEKFVEEPKPSIAEKKTKAKAEKKPVKTELPVLEPNYEDKIAMAPVPQLESPPALDNRRWMIQVASLSDEAKAVAFRDKLRGQGFPATIESVLIAGKGRVYRLKVGPELDAQQAQATKAKIDQLHNVQSIAVPE